MRKVVEKTIRELFQVFVRMGCIRSLENSLEAIVLIFTVMFLLFHTMAADAPFPAELLWDTWNLFS